MALQITRRGAEILGAVVGTAAATVAAGIATERYLLRRSRDVIDPHADEPFGQLSASRAETLRTGQGIDLHVEIVEPEEAAGRRRQATRLTPTIVFVHGFCLDMGTFHFQRTGFAGRYRMVFYDQPGHGRSGRLDHGDYTLEDIADALATVIERTTPTGPMVLVGHSMGGMTIMALAERYPALIAERVVGVALISSSSGDMRDVSFGMPRVVAQARGSLLPVIRAAGPAVAGAVDWARGATSELTWLLTRKYGFGSGPPSPALVSYVEAMNASTSLDVIARYLGAIHAHDGRNALEHLRQVPVVVICGDHDLVTPLGHSIAIANALPQARLETIEGAGHVALLEASETVNARLAEFFTRVGSAAEVTGGGSDPDRRYRGRGRRSRTADPGDRRADP